MKRRILWYIILLICAFTSEAMAQPLTLHVLLQGVKHNRGEIRISVFNNKERAFLPMGGYQGKVETARKGDMFFTFILPPGTYAIGVIHDENSNGVMDLDKHEKPKEGYSLSGTGMLPDFNTTSFRLTQCENIKLKMKYQP